MRILRRLRNIIRSVVDKNGDHSAEIRNSLPDNSTHSDNKDDQDINEISKISLAIDNYTRYRKIVDADTNQHNSKIHWWTRASTIGAWAYTAITVLVLVVSILSIQEARRATHAAVKAADAARDQAENMDRPWIKLIELKRPSISFSGPGMPMQFGVADEKLQANFNAVPVIKNVGKTTAINIHISPRLVVQKWGNGWGDLSKEQKEVCDATQNNSGVSITLFPDDSFDGVGAGNPVFLSESNISSINDGTKYIAQAIVGCIDYQFAASQRHHQTRFIFEVVRADNRSRIFIIGKDANESDILLIRDFQHDYAD